MDLECDIPLPSIGEHVTTVRDNSFVDISKLPESKRSCEHCGKAFSANDTLDSFPVRLPCSCMFCYGDCAVWLDLYKNCPKCNAPFGDPALAHESLERQLENSHRYRQSQMEISAITDMANALSLQQDTPNSTGTSVRASTTTTTTAANNTIARENVEAALMFLNIEPNEVRVTDVKDLETALSVLGLWDGSIFEQLDEILRSLCTE